MITATEFRPPEWLVRDAFALRKEIVETLGLDANAVRPEIVARVTNHMDALAHVKRIISQPPDAFRIKAAEICPGQEPRGDGQCKDTIKTGCNCCWWDMIALDVEDDPDADFGDEEQVRVCECGVAWIARYCDSCRREIDELQRGDDGYEMAVEREMDRARDEAE